MADRFALDIKSLKLVMAGEEMTGSGEDPTLSEFPILGLEISYMVRSFPIVSVIISRAAKTDGKGDVFDFTEGDLGALAAVVMTVTPTVSAAASEDSLRETSDEGEPIDINLFSGHIVADQPSLVVNNVSVGATRQLRLICTAEALDTTPIGLLTYYGTEPQSASADFGIPFELLAEFSSFESSPELDPSNFNKDPIDYLMGCVNTFYSVVDKSIESSEDDEGAGAPSLYDAFYNSEAKPTITLSASSQLGDYIKTFLMRAMASQGTTDALYALLSTFMLDWLPQTAGTDGEPCQMIIRPINAWQEEVNFELQPNMLLETRGAVGYKLNNIIDCWCVSLPNNPQEPFNGCCAIYGPGLGGERGEGEIVELQDLRKALDSRQDAAAGGATGKARYVTARQIPLPGWLSRICVEETQEVPTEGSDVNGATQVTTVTNAAGISDKIKEWASRLAVQAFLSNGRSAMALTARVPLWVWLQLLPHLGDTGVIDIVDVAGDVNDLNSDDLPVKEFFGMLGALNLRITLNNKEFNCSCELQMSSLRNKELQNKYAASDVFYELPEDSDGSPGQGAAKDIAGELQGMLPPELWVSTL